MPYLCKNFNQNEQCQIFYDKLMFIYLTMPNLVKTADELKTNSDKWLFILKNLSALQTIPPALQTGLF